MSTDKIETLLERIALIMQVQARRDFLLLSMSPDKVQKQLHIEYADTYEKNYSTPTPTAAWHIVTKPF
jgi:hypothetical protein